MTLPKASSQDWGLKSIDWEVLLIFIPCTVPERDTNTLRLTFKAMKVERPICKV